MATLIPKLVFKSMSRLAKQSSRDIPHVCFLELIILPIISVDVDVVESLHNSINVETHVNKAVNQIFVIALVSVHTSAKFRYSETVVLPCSLLSQLLLPRQGFLRFWLRFCWLLCNGIFPICALGCICVLDCPLSCYPLELFRIFHEHASDFGILWIFGLRRAEEGLEREESRFNCKHW